MFLSAERSKADQTPEMAYQNKQGFTLVSNRDAHDTDTYNSIQRDEKKPRYPRSEARVPESVKSSSNLDVKQLLLKSGNTKPNSKRKLAQTPNQSQRRKLVQSQLRPSIKLKINKRDAGDHYASFSPTGTNLPSSLMARTGDYFNQNANMRGLRNY